MYTQLKVYAEVQTNLTTWRTDDAGYVINGNMFSTKSTDWDNSNILHRFLLLSTSSGILFAIIFSIVLTHVIFTKAPNHNSQNFIVWHSVLWVSVGVLAQFNVAFLIVEFVQIGIWRSSPARSSQATLLKIINFSAVLILSCASSFRFYVWIQGRRLNESIKHLLLIESWKVLVFFPLNMMVCSCSDKKAVKTVVSTFFHLLFFPTLLTSISLVFLNLFPVLVLFVLYPIEVAAVYSFLTAALILYILVAFYREYKRMLLKDSFPYLSMFPLYLVSIYFFIAFCFLVVFVAILSGYPDNLVLRVILSQLPTLIMLSIIYLVLKRIVSEKKRKLEESVANSERDGQPSAENTSPESSNVSAASPRAGPQASGGQGLSSQQPNYGATNDMREPIL